VLKNFKLTKDRQRAQTKLKLFGDFILPHSKIIDIGCGSGQFSSILRLLNHQVTAVDVVNKTNADDIKPIIYDGKTLPFKDLSFDISMLITVLHHCPQPEVVFKEAVRVSNDKIFILEDVYNNWLMKRLTWFMDSVMNWEFRGHPHSNKSEEAWEALFKSHQLKLIHKKKVKILLLFTQVVYVLEKQR